jgi:RHS repeat-associated protein
VTVLNGVDDKDPSVPEWSADAQGASDWGWIRVHQGLPADPETGLVYNRARYLHTDFGWIQRDLEGYIDGFNLYQYTRSRPLSHTDAFGNVTALPSAAAQSLTVSAAFAGTYALYTTAMKQQNWAAAESAVKKVRDDMIVLLGLGERTVAKPWASKALEEIKRLRGDAVPIPIPVEPPIAIPVENNPPVERVPPTETVPPVAIPRPKEECDDRKPAEPKRCNPCFPSVGTIAAERVDFVPPGKPHWPFGGDHTHLLIVNQSGYPECKCFWNSLGILPGIWLLPAPAKIGGGGPAN